MIRTKFVSKRRSETNVYKLYKVSNRRTCAYLMEVTEQTQSALALVQADEQSAIELFKVITDEEVAPEHLCDIAEDFRHNLLF